jgi:hypothetical protein
MLLIDNFTFLFLYIIIRLQDDRATIQRSSSFTDTRIVVMLAGKSREIRAQERKWRKMRARQFPKLVTLQISRVHLRVK